jgi:hypothetical protein
MRSLVIWTLLFTFAVGTAVARDETVDELKSRVQNALPQDRPKLCVQIAELQLRNADKFYKNGDVELARAAVEDIVAYSEQGRDSAVQTKKHLKNVEIAVRKVAERLRDIKRTISYEDQPAVDHAVQQLEEVRTTLLKQMFSKEKK